jgi:Matrixin
MMDYVVRRREAARSSRNRVARPVLEGLEQRLLMYTPTGDRFVNNSLITWSIMPQGTSLGGGLTNNLPSTLDQELGAGNWEPVIAQAFAVWEGVANVNVAQVGDDGQPFGTGGYQQGNPNEGDIRIGGWAMAPDVLALALLPPTNNGGGDAGDIFFNTTQAWHINSDYDLETVAIHEIGHSVAGLGESSVTQAAEYEYYNGIKQGLATDDVQGIQALWGPRPEDGIEQATHNLTWQNAATCNGVINSQNQVILNSLNVASTSESYWFKVTTPANASNVFTVQVQSQGISELSPRVVIYNSTPTPLTQAIAPTNAYGATIAATITNATPNTTYYIRILGSNAGPTGTGIYSFTANMGTQAIANVPPPYTYVPAQADQGYGGLFEKTAAAEPNSASFQNQVSNVVGILPEGPGLLIPLLSTEPIKLTPTHISVPHPVAFNWFNRLKTQVNQDKTEQN